MAQFCDKKQNENLEINKSHACVRSHKGRRGVVQKNIMVVPGEDDVIDAQEQRQAHRNRCTEQRQNAQGV